MERIKSWSFSLGSVCSPVRAEKGDTDRAYEREYETKKEKQYKFVQRSRRASPPRTIPLEAGFRFQLSTLQIKESIKALRWRVIAFEGLFLLPSHGGNSKTLRTLGTVRGERVTRVRWGQMFNQLKSSIKLKLLDAKWHQHRERPAGQDELILRVCVCGRVNNLGILNKLSRGRSDCVLSGNFYREVSVKY